MAIQKIPILTSVDPEAAGSQFVTDASYSKNILIDKYPDGKTYITQRPGVTITDVPDFSGNNARGRGAYHWEKKDASYAVVNSNVLKDGGSIVGTISASIQVVHFIECESHLVIIDTDNNEGWYIDLNDNVVKITDPVFPPNQSPSKQLAGGGAWLEGTLFVLDTEGVIWNSVDDDPTTWGGLDFIEAGRKEDGGLFLAPHADGIAAFGTQSIEFFYYAGTATGSPLGKREDVFHHVGVYSDNACAVQGDRIFFLGSEPSGTLGVYVLNKFKLDYISNKAIDDALAYSRNQSEYDFIISGLMLRGHQLAFVSAVQAVGITSKYFEDGYLQSQETYVTVDGEDVYDTQYTLVYDLSIGYWTTYDSNILANGGFPVVAGTSRIKNRNDTASVVFLNGEIGSFDVNFSPVDRTYQEDYFTIEDYVEDQDDYVEAAGEDNEGAIHMSIRTPEWDGGTMTTKFGSRLELRGTTLANSSGGTDIQVRWSDDHYRTYSAWRPLSTEFRQKLSRLGKFKRRSHEISYQGIENLRIEEIEMDVRASRYAR